MNRINQNQFFDILFYLRGFFAFLLIPLLLLLNIEYFNNILLHSNIYLFKNRSPNLTYPLMYVVVYYSCCILFTYKLSHIVNKINPINYLYFLPKIKNYNLIITILFLFGFLLKLRVFHLENYFSGAYTGDMYFNNDLNQYLTHFFLPNEIFFLGLSIFFLKFKNISVLLKYFIISYLVLSIFFIINFGGRFLYIVSFLYVFFLMKSFSFYKFKKAKLIFLFLFFLFLFLIIFAPLSLYESSSNENLNFVKKISLSIDHILWRLDVFHLVDYGFGRQLPEPWSSNLFSRNIGLIGLDDTNTGVGYPSFFFFINNEQIIYNLFSIIIVALITSIIYLFIRETINYFGFFFSLVFGLKFILHWPETELILMFVYIKKILIMYIIYITVVKSCNILQSKINFSK